MSVRSAEICRCHRRGPLGGRGETGGFGCDEVEGPLSAGRRRERKQRGRGPEDIAYARTGWILRGDDTIAPVCRRNQNVKRAGLLPSKRRTSSSYYPALQPAQYGGRKQRRLLNFKINLGRPM